jgi:serine/threonine-protein kinase
MGAVYLLRPQTGGEPVALKLLLPRIAVSPYCRATFEREVRYTALLDHPNLVRLRDRACCNGVLYFTMEYCPGGNLIDRIRARGGSLEVPEAVGITLQLLAGLVYLQGLTLPDLRPDADDARAVGLVHRDLKPANVLLSDGTAAAVARIADLGLAKAFQLAGLSGLTAPTQWLGTPAYMSRWQFRDYLRSGPEVDVWAVAAILYFALTGKPPRTFPKDADPAEVILTTLPVPIRQRADEEQLPPPPNDLADLIDDVLRDDRPPRFTAGAFRNRLLRLSGRDQHQGP